MPRKVRELSQRDWDQLLTVAAGYLPMTGGDLHEAMAKALVAHAELIRIIRDTGVTADLARGKVTLFVPEGGGMALAFERTEPVTTATLAFERTEPVATVATATPPSTPPAHDAGGGSLEVVEPGAYISVPVTEEASEIEPDWPEVG